MDWFAAGLPREGAMAAHPRAADVVRRDVPTCRLRERVGDVATRVSAAGWDACVVVDEQWVVLGLLDATALHGDPGAFADEAMRSAPVTWRPHLAVEEVAETLKRQDREHVLITTSDGRLVGLLRRQDAERRAAEARKEREPVSS